MLMSDTEKQLHAMIPTPVIIFLINNTAKNNFMKIMFVDDRRPLSSHLLSSANHFIL